VLHSPESERNFRIAGGWKHLFTLKDVNYFYATMLCTEALLLLAPTGRRFSRGWEKVRGLPEFISGHLL